MQSNSLSRWTYLDNLSGVLIAFCVFLYHLPSFIATLDTSLFLYLRNIFGFFIAWFFFKSGMLYKKRGVKEEFQKCWSRLLVPYLVINVLCISVRILISLFITKEATVLEILKVDLYRESDVFCNPLWFCLSLALVRILYQVFSKERIKPVIVALSFIIAFLLFLYCYRLGVDRRIINIPPWVGNIFLGLFFYGLGDLMKEFQYKNYCFVISAVLFVFFLFVPSYLDFYKNISEKYLLAIVYNLSGIILFNNIFKRWLNVKIPLLTHVGANSMIYYITHYTFFIALFYHYVEAPGWLVYIVSFLLTVVFLYLMDLVFTKTRMKKLIS